MGERTWRVGVAGLGTVGAGLLKFLGEQPGFAPAGGQVVVSGVSARSRSRPRSVDISGHAWFDERWGARPCCFSVHAAQAARMMLDAIAASDGSRGEVREHLFRTPVDDSYVGNFRIDRYGDTTRTTMGVYSVKDGRLKFETAVTPPANLFARE